MSNSEKIIGGRYQIVRQLGNGGTSRVYLVRDKNVGKLWAAKQISGRVSLYEKLAAHEIDIMRQLEHPMFPRIVDAFKEGEYIYIISDYIEGIGLWEFMQNETVSHSQIIDWIIEIAYALTYLHEMTPKMLYLDLKPENVIIRKDGTIALIDFGIARRIAGEAITMGTPGYAAPEQYRVEVQNELGESTDLFALGMTFYALLSGQTPNKDYEKQRNNIKQNKSIKRAYKQVILTCTCYDAANRYQTARELIRRLVRIQPKFLKKKRIRSLLLIILCAITALGVYKNRLDSKRDARRLAYEMVKATKPYMRDGEYLPQGIRVICSYLESGCLEEETAQKYTYEVAMNYFNVQRNYQEAEKYFLQLSEEEYPEKKFLVKLCELQTQFVKKGDVMSSCLKQFYTYNLSCGISEKTCRNELMIAACYEENEGEIERGVELAIVCLENGMKRLEYLENNVKQIYQAEYARRLCILYERFGNRTLARQYGELAVGLLDPDDEQAISDIKERIK